MRTPRFGSRRYREKKTECRSTFVGVPHGRPHRIIPYLAIVLPPEHLVDHDLTQACQGDKRVFKRQFHQAC